MRTVNSLCVKELLCDYNTEKFHIKTIQNVPFLKVLFPKDGWNERRNVGARAVFFNYHVELYAGSKTKF